MNGRLAAVDLHVTWHGVQTTHVEYGVEATGFCGRFRDGFHDGGEPVGPLLQRPQVRHQIVFRAERHEFLCILVHSFTPRAGVEVLTAEWH